MNNFKRNRCQGVTRDGNRCKRWSSPGSEYCHHHADQADPEYDHPPEVSRRELLEWAKETEVDRALRMVQHLRSVADVVEASLFVDVAAETLEGLDIDSEDGRRV